MSCPKQDAAVQVTSLQRELAEAEVEVQRAARLLKLADPEGYFKEGSHAAERAKQQGIAREEQRRAAVAAKRAEQLVCVLVIGLWPCSAVIDLQLRCKARSHLQCGNIRGRGARAGSRCQGQGAALLCAGGR